MYKMDNKVADKKSEGDEDTFKARVMLSVFCLLALALVFTLPSYLKSKGIVADSGLTESGEDDYDIFAEPVSLVNYSDMQSGAKDSDGDGVLNWQEIVSYTDPGDINSVDREGLFAINNSSEEASKSTNFTELISRDLYTSTKYEESGTTVDAELLAATANSNLEELLMPQKIILDRPSSKFTTKNLEVYASIMSMLFNAQLSSGYVEMEEIKGDNNFKKTREFYNTLSQTCQLAKTLRDVPDIYVGLHTEHVYNCETYRNIIAAIMEGEEQDPIKLMAALNLHSKTFGRINKNLEDYKSSFIKEKKLNLDTTKFPTNKIYYQ